MILVVLRVSWPKRVAPSSHFCQNTGYSGCFPWFYLRQPRVSLWKNIILYFRMNPRHRTLIHATGCQGCPLDFLSVCVLIMSRV
jgi:hypothetical protein